MDKNKQIELPLNRKVEHEATEVKIISDPPRLLHGKVIKPPTAVSRVK